MAVPRSLERALRKVGVEVSIVTGADRTTLPTKEFAVINRSSQATKPFILESYRKSQFPYNTQAKSGDYIITTNNRDKFIVMNIAPKELKNKNVIQDAILYLTNTEVTVQKEVSVYNPVTFRDEITWTTIDQNHANIPCLITGTRFGNETSEEDNIGSVATNQHVCFLPLTYEVDQNYRLIFADTVDSSGKSVSTRGEVYKVDAAQRFNFPNCYELTLIQDRR